jgi:hypothetical protein
MNEGGDKKIGERGHVCSRAILRRNYTVLHCMYFSGDILLQCYSVRILEGDLYCSA